MELIVWFVVSVSTTIFLSRGSIFEDIKTRIIGSLPAVVDSLAGELMYCAQCLGFWVGFIGCAAFPLQGDLHPFVTSLFAGVVTSTLSICMDRLIYGNPDSDSDSEDIIP